MSVRTALPTVLGFLLSIFTLLEVNYPHLAPHSQLAFFAALGMVICFLIYPAHRRWSDRPAARKVNAALALVAGLCGLFVIIQTEPFFQRWWMGGLSLGNRAGRETSLDLLVGLIGLLLVLEATRRTIGWTLPVLSLLFLAYAYGGSYLPDALFPHRGYSLDRIISQTFLQGQGVFGVALRVMFIYVFLFIIFGSCLQKSGATRFIVSLSQRFFQRSAGGPAKVAVVSSGFMGSLSGSAIANTVTTGTFTIPMMKAAGLRSQVAAGIEAAASSGGALVPPVMGAGAYMMLELVSPPVTYLQIIRAALLPALLYYLSLFLIVHFYSKKTGEPPPSGRDDGETTQASSQIHLFEGIVFLTALLSLIGFLAAGYSPFRAVSLSLCALALVSFFNPRTRLTAGSILEALGASSRDMVPLIGASACVGIIIGIVTLTGIGARIPAVLLPLAEGNLFLALVLVMISTIILGMGLPSAVCYLLMATLIGPALGQLGVIPLAAHFFIFYFGMMSMVTPPVALAAYAAASIAGTPIMQTALAAFRFALVGFTLPYMFVFRPQLLMLTPAGETVTLAQVLPPLAIAILGVTSFAAGISGYLISALSPWMRVLMFLTAALLLYPGLHFVLAGWPVAIHDLLGVILFIILASINWSARKIHHRCA